MVRAFPEVETPIAVQSAAVLELAALLALFESGPSSTTEVFCCTQPAEVVHFHVGSKGWSSALLAKGMTASSEATRPMNESLKDMLFELLKLSGI
jgi:hypothetical protein